MHSCRKALLKKQHNTNLTSPVAGFAATQPDEQPEQPPDSSAGWKPSSGVNEASPPVMINTEHDTWLHSDGHISNLSDSFTNVHLITGMYICHYISEKTCSPPLFCLMSVDTHLLTLVQLVVIPPPWNTHKLTCRLWRGCLSFCDAQKL